MKTSSGEVFEHYVEALRGRLRMLSKVAAEFFYGMTVHELHLEAGKERATLEHLFMLVVFGDLLGLPLLPPYYSMRLLPFIMPSIHLWKRSMLREKDLTDLASVDL